MIESANYIGKAQPKKKRYCQTILGDRLCDILLKGLLLGRCFFTRVANDTRVGRGIDLEFDEFTLPTPLGDVCGGWGGRVILTFLLPLLLNPRLAQAKVV